MKNRNRNRLWLWVGVLGILGALALSGQVLAEGLSLPPRPPHWLWGAITLDGTLAEDGTPVRVLVQGVNVVTTTVRTANGVAGLYSIAVPADDPVRAGVQGGTPGDPVTFGIDGYELVPMTVWTLGKVQNLPLSNGPFTYTFAADISGTQNFTFTTRDGHPALIINAGGAGLGATTIHIRANQDCTTVPGEGVRRCFDITPANPTGQNATLTFYFYSSQMPGGSLCEDMHVYHWDGGAWQPLTLDARDCEHDPHWVRVTGVADFSPFVLAANVPNAVTLRALVARPAWSLLGFCVLLSGVAIVLNRRTINP